MNSINLNVGTLDLKSFVQNQITINQLASDGIANFNARILTETYGMATLILPDASVNIAVNGCTLFTGYVDSSTPNMDSETYVNEQWINLVGRDNGQDLLNKSVNKTSSAFPYNNTLVSTIVTDMLSNAGTSITVNCTLMDNIYASYQDKADEQLIEGITGICNKSGIDFYVDANKVLQMYPVGSISSGVTLDSSNIIGDLAITKFDNFEMYNKVKITGSQVSDGWTDDDPSYLGWVGATGNSVVIDNVTLSAGGAAIKCLIGTNPSTCELSLSLPYTITVDGTSVDVYNYSYLPFDKLIDESLSFDMWYEVYHNYVNAYMELTDTNNNVIRWYGATPSYLGSPPMVGGWVSDKGKWILCTVSIGRNITDALINPSGTAYSYDKWLFINGATTFNWRVKKITIVIEKTTRPIDSHAPDYLIIDNLQLPITMQSIVNYVTGQSSWKLRQYNEVNTNLYSQKDVNEYADSQLENKKLPASAVKVRVMGSTGIVGGVWKLRPGFMVHIINTLNDLDNDLRISESNITLTDSPVDGNDFYVDLVLTTATSIIRGSRLTNVSSNSGLGIIREVVDRVRSLEKNSNATNVNAVTSSGGGGGIVNWNAVPYITVLGNSYLRAMNQIEGSCPTYSAQTLLDVLWHFTGGTWDAKDNTLPMGDAYLRFKNTIVGNENYGNLGIIFSSMEPTNPILYWSDGLMIKKDVTAGGFLGANQGALFLGSGLDGQSDMPQIILMHSGSLYNYMATLDINDADGNLAAVKMSTIYVDGILHTNGSLYTEFGWNGGTINNPIVINHDGAAVTFKDIPLYRQTVPALVLELGGSLIVDGQLNCAGLSASGNAGIDGTLSVGKLTSFTIPDIGAVIKFNDISVYRQTSPSTVLEISSGLIVDGQINSSGISVNGAAGITGTLTALRGTFNTIYASVYQNLPDGSSFSGNLSDLSINADKSWNGKGISAIGTISGVSGSFDGYLYTDGLSAEYAGISTSLSVGGLFKVNTINPYSGNTITFNRLRGGTIYATSYQNLPAGFSGNLSDLSIDANKNWGGKGISALGTISGVAGSFNSWLYVNALSAENIGVATSLNVAGRGTFGTVSAGVYQNLPASSGVSISAVTIDANKNWNGKGISAVGTISGVAGSFNTFLYTNGLSAEYAGIATSLSVAGVGTFESVNADYFVSETGHFISPVSNSVFDKVASAGNFLWRRCIGGDIGQYTDLMTLDNSGNLTLINNLALPATGTITASTALYLTSPITVFPNGIIRPPSNNQGQVGGDGAGSNYYWASVWANYLKYHTSSAQFDYLDDLALVKNYTSKKEVIDGVEVDVIDVEKSLPHLLDKNGFRDPARDTGFLLGCVKKLTQELDTQKSINLQLLNRLEIIEKKLSEIAG